MMLGLADIGVWLAYVLSILSTLLCVGYGLMNWNRGQEPLQKEDRQWAKEEKEEIEEAV